MYVCHRRWADWFYEPAEHAYTVTAEPSDFILTAGADGIRSRTVSWRSSSADSVLFVLSRPCGVTDSLIISGRLIASTGGEQYFFNVQFDSLSSGEYHYTILPFSKEKKAQFSSSFLVKENSAEENFLLFGDMLLDEASEPFEFSFDSVDAVLYTGNICASRMEQSFRGWSRFAANVCNSVPQLLVPGDRDFSKGVVRKLDPRWKARFVYPDNGPARFSGSVYYVDYPLCRLIFIDTQSLLTLSDHTVLQSWLTRVLNESDDRWKVVVMHHPVHAAAAGGDNLFLYAALHLTLDKADLVFQGHDLTYARRADISLSDLINEEHTVPVYVLTNSSVQHNLPKCSPLDQRIGSGATLFNTLKVEKERLSVTSRYIQYPDSVYDAFFITKPDGLVTEKDSLPEELITLPERFEQDNGLRVRRFRHIRDARTNNR